MAFYIKVPPHMAEEMHLGADAKLPDGNYVSYITQFRDTYNVETFEMQVKAPTMGCAIIQPWQLPEERSGRICTPLPEPTDPAFIPQELPSVEDTFLLEEEVLVEADEALGEIVEETVEELLEEEETEEGLEEDAEEGGEE